ncbi:MAG TPA: cytochrome B, partial [Elusimicrobia bacterium]|nr:cytochrome B [Elusimicrobiota bacterium]
MSKPKVAFFDFACCEGCQIEFTNYGDPVFLELLKHVDVVEFRE